MPNGIPHDPGIRTSKSVTAAAVFVITLLIQTAVPLVRLWSPRPTRFGWQMFIAKAPRKSDTLVLRDGTRRPADLASYVALSRGAMDLEKALPEHLCRLVAGLESVLVDGPAPARPRVFTCR